MTILIGSSDYYAVLGLDAKKKRTPVASSNINPFWAEEFTFEDVDEDFAQFDVSVYNKGDGDEEDVLVGKVAFPRAFITSSVLDDDQWFALASGEAENVVSGDLRVRITHIPPTGEMTDHVFSVNIVAARNLSARNEKTADPYVVGHLFPDTNVVTTQRTSTKKSDLNPKFQETLVFTTNDIKKEGLALHLSVWHHGNEEDLFMGQCLINLTNFVSKSVTDRWVKLSPKLGAVAELKKMIEKFTKSNPDDKSMTKPRMLAAALQSVETEAKSKSKKNIHKFSEMKFASTSYCAKCFEVIQPFDVESQCKECRVNCHTKCSVLMGKNCGQIPLLRLRLSYLAVPVYLMTKYEKMLDVISEDSYSLCTLFGFVIQEREDLARSIIRILDQRGKAVDFIKNLLNNEVQTSANVATLFRANSMASKAIDVYMKHVGMSYLKAVLGEIIEKISSQKLSTEVDPTRLKNSKNMDANWKQLKQYMSEVVEAIFRQEPNIPLQFRQIFEYLQDIVTKKFPKDNLVRYTSVAGFIFLRFFTPALLSPKLFNLLPQFADEKTSRTYTLLAKTLQNLANMVEFGDKEAYMKPMNDFIQSHISPMKSYIDGISRSQVNSIIFKITPFKTDVPPIDAAQEAATIFEIIVKSVDKIVESVNLKSGGHKAIISLLSYMKKVLIELDRQNVKADVGANLAKIKVLREEEKQKSLSIEDLSQDEVVKKAILYNTKIAAVKDKVPKRRWTLFSRRSSSARPISLNLDDPALNFQIEEESTGIDEEELKSATEMSHNSSEGGDKSPVPPLSKRESISGPPAPELASNKADAKRRNGVSVCEVCKEPCNDKENMSFAFGCTYHNEHFVCSVCSAPLKNDFKKQLADGKLFCKDHLVGAEQTLAGKRSALKATSNSGLTGRAVCESCKTGIAGTPTTVGSKKYHAECISCAECTKKLDASAFEVLDDLPYCKKDYQELTGAICSICSESFSGKEELIALGKRKFHAKCKKCDQCGAILLKTPYFTTDKNVLCVKHKAEFTDCRRCKGKITDAKVLIALKKQYQYHIDHFTCTTCQTGLETKQFFEREDQPYCVKCYFEKVILEFASYK